MFENEEWRVCVQAPDYMVSSLGRVMTIKTGKIRRPNTTIRYHRYQLRVNGKPEYFAVSVLACTAWYGEKPAEQDARHLDDDYNNNRIENLAWGTRLQNVQDRMNNARPFHRLHPGAHEEIRRAHFLYDTSKNALSHEYGVRRSCIQQICKTGMYHGVGQSV